jgi:Asp-tRNA(Asn)/Glu-tRNA(Gln) amidotransferase A subunit family amidase
MPISIQVVAHAYEDEKALAVMSVLDKHLNFRMPCPEFLKTTE